MEIADFVRQIDQQMREQDALYHAAAAAFGLSDTAMWILYHSSEANAELTQQELCRQSFFAKQTVNTAINQLARDGLVALLPIPGTRNQKRICLTDAGRALAARTTERLKAAERAAFAHLDEEALRAYLQANERLTGCLREEFERMIQKER